MIIKCQKCSHEWHSRTDNPKQCPQCKSRYYKGERVHYVKNIPLGNIPPGGTITLGALPERTLPTSLYAPLKIRLLTAMRDKLPIKFKFNNTEITEIV